MKSTTLENVQWTLVQLDGKAIEPSSRGAPTLMLSSKDMRLSGFAGCNRMLGGYELNGETLKFNAMATTRMACIDVTPEEPLLLALGATARWKVVGNTLELFDASGNTRTRWTVTMIESGDRK
ncbi:MAG TPA: META domain-containing protein [Steroidobacteraceae bacterium]|nr:META domain-containing protein [Steroidobacteraceae bacterium]